MRFVRDQSIRALVVVSLIPLPLTACGSSNQATDLADVIDAATAKDANSGDGNSSPTQNPSAGCGGARTLALGTTTERSLMHDGLERTYRVRVPASYDAGPTPLTFVLHGGLGSGEQIENRSSQMNPIAEREGFVVVYPDGVPRFPNADPGPQQIRTWNGGGCCGFAASEDVDDVGFLIAVLDTLEAELCIDRSRVYSTGMSNGAIMSYRLACERSERIAAIAPVAATMFAEPCSPTRPVPVLHVHGDEDKNAPYDGGMGCGLSGEVFPSVAATMSAWKAINQCTGEPSLESQTGNGTCEHQGDCIAETVLCTVEGGDHSWPGGTPSGAGLPMCQGDGEQSQSFDASEHIWRFFERHSL